MQSISNDIKSKIIESYLKQQLDETNDETGQDDACSMNNSQIQVPDNESLTEFKQQVKQWLELDNSIKTLAAVLKEKKDKKNELTIKILEFMAKYNIEDLNTKEGKLRYKTAMTKAPLSQKIIKEKVIQLYDPKRTCEEFAKLVFESRETIQKPTLRRVSIKSTPNTQ